MNRPARKSAVAKSSGFSSATKQPFGAIVYIENMNTKGSLSERDIITKYILPAIEASGWDRRSQIREEVSFTAGRIFVKGKLTKRGEKKRAIIEDLESEIYRVA